MYDIIHLTTEQAEALHNQAYWLDDEGLPLTNIYYVSKIYGALGLEVPESLLNDLQSASNNEQYTIYDYYINEQEDKTILPKHVLFPELLTITPYKDYKLEYGERTQTIYYVDFDETNQVYSNPIIKIEYTYDRDPTTQFIKKITRTFYWMKKSGEWSTETYVDMRPFVSESAKLKELKKVRQNILDEAESLALKLGLRKEIKRLYRDYSNEISLYENAGTEDFSLAIDAITETGDYAWLANPTTTEGVTVKMFLVNFFKNGLLTDD